MSSRFEYKKTKTSFYERQNVRYMVLYALTILAILLFAASAVEKHITGKSWISSSIEVWHYAIFVLVIPVPLLILLVRTRLDTIIDEDGVMYKWSPYEKRFHLLHWSAIKDVVLLDLKPSGLFWRFKRKNHLRFFLGGRFCFEVRLRNGHTVLFGTRKPEELQRALTRNAGNKFNLDESNVEFDYS